MFFEKISENEFFESLSKNLDNVYSFDQTAKQDRIKKAKQYIKEAADALSSAGLKSEAECVVMLLKDPAIEGLSGDDLEGMAKKMEENLKEKGWVFNADDTDDNDCEDGEQPQLTQEELKKLREMLK